MLSSNMTNNLTKFHKTSYTRAKPQVMTCQIVCYLYTQKYTKEHQYSERHSANKLFSTLPYRARKKVQSCFNIKKNLRGFQTVNKTIKQHSTCDSESSLYFIDNSLLKKACLVATENYL